MLLALGIVFVLSILKFRSEEFTRPLGEDELITLRVYTGAGINGNGTPRDLSKHSHLEALRPLTGSELGVGFYASLGCWAEPNNHVVHSTLVNLFIGRIQPIEAAVRLPALLAGGTFAMVLAWLCIVCGRAWGAPVAAAIAMVWPYVSWYSAESRGYASMMVFIVLFILSARWVLSRPSSIWSGTTLTVVSVLTVMNLVNLSADWIAPGLVLLYLFPHWMIPNLPDVALARKALLAIGLATAAILGVFFLDRLPYLVSAMNQYGIPYDGMDGYVEYLVELWNYLFPTPLWKGIGILGLLGAGVALANSSTRGVVVLSIVSLMASAVHFAIAGKFPYLRNCGYFLLPILFGLAILADSVTRRSPLKRGRWYLVVGMTLGVVSLEQIEPVTNPDVHFEGFTRTMSEIPVEETPGRVILERHVMKSLDLYYPENWLPIETPFPTSGSVDLIRVEKIGNEFRLCRVRFVISETGPADWIVWHPPFCATAVNPEPLLSELKEAGANSIQPFHSRYQAKLAVRSRVTVILAEGSDAAAIHHVADKHGGVVLHLRKLP
jgi:hypothetical protein